MGNRSNCCDCSSLLAEKDVQIAKLEAQIQVYIARTSHMQARLLSTLDAMDAQRDTHIRELASERRAKDSLSHKLDRYLDHVRSMEAERDDMREVVAILLKKVELCNDYSLWPYSQMRLPHPLEHVKLLDNNCLSEDSPKDAVYEFATALVTSLRSELEEERRAHSLTRERMSSEILLLSAKLARREAELARCAVHIDDTLLFEADPAPSAARHHAASSLRNGKHVRSQSKPDLFSDAEIWKILELSAARDRVLELEVNHLKDMVSRAHDVGQAQARLPSPHHISVLVQTETADDEVPCGPDHSRMSRPLSTHRDPSKQRSSPPPSPKASSSHIHEPIPLSTPKSPPLMPLIPAVSPSPYALTPAAFAYFGVSFHDQGPFADPPPALNSPVQTSLEGLENDIMLLSTKIDLLREKRDALKTIIQQEKGHSEGSPEHSHNIISERPHNVSPPEFDDEDNESMELVSPIRNTILSVHGISVEPHTIPLPASPSSPPYSSDEGTERIQCIEEALHTARREVEEREVVLEVLRENVLAIRLALPGDDGLQVQEGPNNHRSAGADAHGTTSRVPEGGDGG